jgi:hypothetical protein
MEALGLDLSIDGGESKGRTGTRGFAGNGREASGPPTSIRRLTLRIRQIERLAGSQATCSLFVWLVGGVDFVGDSHKGPIITGENPISSQNNKNTNELTNCKLHLAQSRPGDRRSPRPRQPQWPTKWSASALLGRNSASLEGPGAEPPKIRLARGLVAPLGESPPRSRGPAPYHQNSASLDGWTPPRMNLRLARGRPELAGLAPTP